MKVIHLISGGDTGGAKTHIHYLLSGICEHVDAKLVCFMRGEFSDEAQALGIPTLILDGNIFKTLRQLKTLVREENYELIHSHGARGNFIASLLKRACKIPVVTTVHSDPKLDYLGRPAAGLIYGTLNTFALRRADYLVGVSDAMKSLLIERGYSPNKIFTIYNGVDFSVKPRVENRTQYLRALGLDADENSVVVGIAARLDPVKDVATLLKGFAFAEKSCPELRLVIAGDGAQAPMLKALALELGIAEKTCFAGWMTDVNTFFASLDINTLTSVSETFPYALTEGARAGLATISSRVGGVPKLIVEGKTGFLFPAGDYEVLGEKLVQLCKGVPLRKKLGAALLEKAGREFSVEATTQRQLDIYAEVFKREALRKNKKRNGIVICGAYGMGNAGDDAILEAIVGEMRAIDAFMPITALSRRPQETRLKYGIESLHMFSILNFDRVVRHTSLYLSGGGSLIQNVTSRRSLWYYLYTIWAAKRRGNAVMMYGCGIGPIVDKRDEAWVRRVINSCVDVITLREKFSLSELNKLGVTAPELIVSSDPALSLPCADEDLTDAAMKKHGLDPNGEYICFSVRSWTGIEEKIPAFAHAADFAAQTLGLTPVFLLINRQEDGKTSEAVCAAMKTPPVIIDEAMDSALTIGLLSRMKVVVSMRLHGLIFAASQGVPLVGVSYDPKVTAFLSSVGEEKCLPFEELSAAKLESMIEQALQSSSDRDGRKHDVEKLKAAEALNSQWARRLLQK